MKILNEDYPSSFNIEEFKELTSFAKRKAYCDQHFANNSYICSGSSRYVYRIDTNKVLKLAKNKKGLLQNEAEWELFNDAYAPGSLAPVYEGDDENYTWIEMAYADKLTEKKFEKITGFSWENFVIKVGVCYEDGNMGSYFHSLLERVPEEVRDQIDESPIYEDISELIINFSTPHGDLIKLNSYGIINGEIYLIDYGLTTEIFNNYYRGY
jgi:hypothetical protein